MSIIITIHNIFYIYRCTADSFGVGWEVPGIGLKCLAFENRWVLLRVCKFENVSWTNFSSTWFSRFWKGKSNSAKISQTRFTNNYTNTLKVACAIWSALPKFVTTTYAFRHFERLTTGVAYIICSLLSPTIGRLKPLSQVWTMQGTRLAIV